MSGNLTHFMEAVQNMRSLQKEYFRTRDGVVLVRCKNAEKAVDDYLRGEMSGTTGNEIPEPDTQQKLF